MKITFFCLSILFLSSTSMAGEVVPLFDEMPSFQKEEVKQEKTGSSLFDIQSQETQERGQQKEKKSNTQNTQSKKPNLGRHSPGRGGGYCARRWASMKRVAAWYFSRKSIAGLKRST